MRRRPLSLGRQLSRRGTDPRARLALLLLAGVAACWVVAGHSSQFIGPLPLVARVGAASQLGAAPASTPWGSFLRIVLAAQQGNSAYVTGHSTEPRLDASSVASWSLGYPRFVSEHDDGPIATIDYAVIAPTSGGTRIAVAPRSVELQRSGGTWLLRVGAAPVPAAASR